jgi:hypothetical protein
MTANPTVIRQSEESEEDRSFWKVLILAALGAAGAFFSFFLFDKFLVEGNLVRLLGSVIFATIFLSFFILQVLFTKSRAKIIFLGFVQAFAPIFLFTDHLYPVPSILLITAFAVFFILLVAGAVRGERELANSLNIKFFSVAKGIVSRAVAGMLIAFSVILYLAYFVWGGFNEDFSRRLVNQTLTSSEPIVKLVLTEISFENTVDRLFRDLAESQLRRIKIDGEEEAVEFQRLPPPEQEKIISEVAFALRVQAEGVVGPLNVNRPANEEVFRIVSDYVEGLTPATKSILSVAIAVLFFFSARGIAFLFYWLPEVIAFIIFKLFLVTGFAYVSLESRSREFIMLS